MFIFLVIFVILLSLYLNYINIASCISLSVTYFNILYNRDNWDNSESSLYLHFDAVTSHNHD